MNSRWYYVWYGKRDTAVAPEIEITAKLVIMDVLIAAWVNAACCACNYVVINLEIECINCIFSNTNS